MSDATSSELLEQACAVLRLKQPRVLSAEETTRLANRLATHGFFDYAGAVVEVSRRGESCGSQAWIELGQKLAFFTTRDTRLPVRERLAAALEVLHGCGLSTTTDPETLGLAGSIFKRRWEMSRRLEDLQQAANYYSRGFAHNGVGADGYLAINTAYLLELLAHELERQQLPTNFPELRAKAREIRRQIIESLEPVDETQWWPLATLIEAYIGIGDLDGAKLSLAKARAISPAAWQRESMLRQVVALITIRDIDDASRNASLATLTKHFAQEVAALRGGPQGRVGLALSGGGFRAALFHLGVLARLAEADTLRHVEILSCVSGGSIVGSHYYLLLRQLLQNKPDSQITRDDYVSLISNLIAAFREGTRANLRMRSLSGCTANLRMLTSRHYTRAERIAELYDEYFFARTPGASAGQRVRMREIGIVPAGHPAGAFNLERDNWGRRNKVPSLVINGTTLNTGHGWQFTPTRLGEIRFSRERVDANPHLQSLYYEQAPAAHRDLPLSRAVAASSCVPALFPPVRLADLYPDKLIALVDGAIHDNQGVAGLLAEDCRTLIVSDGAGHMEAMDRVPLGYLPVAARSMGILQTRLREAQFRELSAMHRLGAIDMVFMHLKQGLKPQAVAWTGCDMRISGADADRASASSSVTPYGVLTEVQQLLARMRTDLDAFSDLEANALMYDGYQIAGHYLSSLKWLKESPQTGPTESWPFLCIAKMMSGEDAAGSQRLLQHLRAGALRGGKWLRLSRIGRWAARGAVAMAVLFFVLATFFSRWALVEHLAGRIVLGVGAIFLLLAAVSLAAQYRPMHRGARSFRPALTQSLADVAVFMFGWLALVDVACIRRAYLKLGKMELVSPQQAPFERPADKC